MFELSQKKKKLKYFCLRSSAENEQKLKKQRIIRKRRSMKTLNKRKYQLVYWRRALGLPSNSASRRFCVSLYPTTSILSFILPSSGTAPESMGPRAQNTNDRQRYGNWKIVRTESESADTNWFWYMLEFIK